MGDTVTIDFGTETLDCIVVAYFQSMNQLGAVIRLHEDAPTDFSYIASLMSYQINLPIIRLQKRLRSARIR